MFGLVLSYCTGICQDTSVMSKQPSEVRNRDVQVC
jgi:hypothetical protein